MLVIDEGQRTWSFEGGVVSAKSGKPNLVRGSLQHVRTSSVKVIESGNGLPKIVQSLFRSRDLARMLRSSPVAIFRLLLADCPPLSNSRTIGSG